MGNAQAKRSDEMVIGAPASFDSNFTLISPKSDISDPSNFDWKQTKPISNVPTPALQRSNSVVIRNVPPVPPELHRERRADQARRFDNGAGGDAGGRESNPRRAELQRPSQARHSGRQNGKAKAKTKTNTKTKRRFFFSKKKIRRAKEAFRGCVQETNRQAANLGECAKKTKDFVAENDIVAKANTAAVRRVKASAENVRDSSGLGKALQVRQSSNPTVSDNKKPYSAKEEDYRFISERVSLDSAISEYNSDESNEEKRSVADDRSETSSPTIDPLSMSEVGLHEETPYFARLCKQHQEALATPAASKDRGGNGLVLCDDGHSPAVGQETPVVSLFRSAMKREGGSSGTPADDGSVEDPKDTARPDNQQYLEQRTVKDAGSTPSAKWAMNLRTPNGPSRTGGRMEERSHPVKPNANDYRSIALGKGDRSPVGAGHGGHDGIVRYPAESPSVHSMSSSVAESPMNPLLSNQVLSNAAFLFSPSYVGSDGASLQRVQANRDSTFSISTFASRARLSTVSSRSRPVVTIPVSSSWSMKSGQQQHGSSVAYASAEDYEDGGIGASGRYSEGDDDGVRHLISKHVRFSDTGEDKPGPTEGTKPIDKPHQSGSDRSSLFRSGPVVEVHSMGIETKISDLTDQSSLWSGMGRQGRGDGAHSLPKHDAEIENDDTNQGRNVDMNFLSSRTVNAFGRLSLDEEEGNDDDDEFDTDNMAGV